MAYTKFRTLQEVEYSKEQERYSQIAEGKPYEGGNPSFPVQEYFQNKLLGKDVRMLDLNAGSALINQLVVDTITNLEIEGDDLQEWTEEIELTDILEEAANDLYANGFFVGQFVKDDIETAVNINPGYWYPNLPALTHHRVESGKVIIPLTEYDNQNKPIYYAYVEEHEQKKYTRYLYKLDRPDDTRGNLVNLSTIDRFADLEEEVEVEFSIFQKNRKRSSRSFRSQSILLPVWEQLQEINEIKTQLRQERIKHFRAKIAAPVESLQRSSKLEEDVRHSKEQAAIEQQRVYSMNQEVFPIPVGGQLPAYIQRDLESITKGLEMVDKTLSEICATTGFPRSVFNLDEKGQIHVATEEKKDARYMRHVLRGQRKIISYVRFLCEKKKPGFAGEIKMRNPFDISQSELTEILRKQNPTASFVSTREAVDLLYADRSKEERERIIGEIQDEGVPDGFDRTAVDLNQ